jgi:hypothetical protein
MRNENCPICGSDSGLILKLGFGVKLNLPTTIEIRHCVTDNFMFVGNGCQTDYDDYYKSIANDSNHAEVSGANKRSVIAELQMQHLARALAGFFDEPRKVLDFGCGEASLLVELASEFPTSTFVGFDPGPAAELAGSFMLRSLILCDMASVNAASFSITSTGYM